VRKFTPLLLCVAFALLLPSSQALAQSGGGATPLWANDQAAADADFAGGQYDQAIAVYARAIATAESGNRDAATYAAISKMLVNEGNCLLKLHRTDEALAAYAKAAPLSPNPGTAYFNLCATYYNTGKTTDSLAACDKAIQFDPGKADAYFIKGSLLVAQATLVNGKYSEPPGTIEALNKYLELAPNGAHAGDVKQMLDLLK
jgi:tetratricopeptide (TPR) repeat protein